MLVLLAVIMICLADCIELSGQWKLIAIYDAQGKKHLDGLDRLLGEEYIFRYLSIDFNTLTFGKDKKKSVVYGLVIHPLEAPRGFDLLVPNPKKELRLPGIYKITTHKTLKLKINFGNGLRGPPFPRPKSFEAEEAGATLVLEYERSAK